MIITDFCCRRQQQLQQQRRRLMLKSGEPELVVVVVVVIVELESIPPTHTQKILLDSVRFFSLKQLCHFFLMLFNHHHHLKLRSLQKKSYASEC